MSTRVIDKLLLKYPFKSTSMSEKQLRMILTNLEQVLIARIKGAVLELGCSNGNTSVFIRRMLDVYDKNREFHVYDSFKGLPEKLKEDENLECKRSQQFKKGLIKVSENDFIYTFRKADLELPVIHSGWFHQILSSAYPPKIAFAFLDGDFYFSIYSSWLKIYYKLARGARVHIHDYGWNVLPGVKKACDDFFRDKLDDVIQCEDQQGLMIKL